MRNRWIWCGIVVVCAACFFMGTVVAQEGEDKGMGGGMQMPEWMKLTKEHADFQKSVGEWSAKTKFMIPGAPPMESTGTAVTKIIMDGRFMQQSFKGSMMGAPFEGLLHVGYDTVNKEFITTWIDSMSPYLYVSRGTTDDKGVLWLEGEEPDPMANGKMKDSVMSLEWLDENKYVLTFYTPQDDGSKVSHGSITYTRKK